jgi:hypothetical protein
MQAGTEPLKPSQIEWWKKTITTTQNIHNPHPTKSHEEPIPDKLVRRSNGANGDLLDAEDRRTVHVNALNAASAKQEKKTKFQPKKHPPEQRRSLPTDHYW